MGSSSHMRNPGEDPKVGFLRRKILAEIQVKKGGIWETPATQEEERHVENTLAMWQYID